jgi:hypothetical protein
MLTKSTKALITRMFVESIEDTSSYDTNERIATMRNFILELAMSEDENSIPQETLREIFQHADALGLTDDEFLYAWILSTIKGAEMIDEEEGENCICAACGNEHKIASDE